MSQQNRDLYEYLDTLGFAGDLPGLVPQRKTATVTASSARLIFVGEGTPSAEPSGQLLTKMIEAMGLSRAVVPIFEAPVSELQAQIEALQPEVVVCLGAAAAQGLLQTERSVDELRGHFHAYGSSTSVLVTYSPAFCLKNPQMKKPVWEDLQQVMTKLGMKGS